MKNIVRKSTILDLQKTPRNSLKSRAFPQFLFMTIMSPTLGRAMKKKRSRRRGNLSPIQSLLVSDHHLRSVSLHRSFTHLCLLETFSLVWTTARQIGIPVANFLEFALVLWAYGGIHGVVFPSCFEATQIYPDLNIRRKAKECNRFAVTVGLSLINSWHNKQICN